MLQLHKKFIVLFCMLLLTGCATMVDLVTSSPVSSNAKKRSVGKWIDDQAIETIVAVNIKKADSFLRQARIQVISFNGNVLLVGQVMNESLKDIAGITAQEIDKVCRVYNQLEVIPNISLVQQSKDSWITAKIKSMFLKDKQIGSIKIKVITENSTVYLLGLVNKVEANKAVAIARETTGVKKVVKLFEYK